MMARLSLTAWSVAVVGGALLLIVETGIAAEPGTPPGIPAQQNATIAPSSQELALNEFVRKAAQQRRDGVGSRITGLQWQDVAWRDAAMRALNNNLDIKRGQVFNTQAQVALQEASALFDPVFTLTAQFARASRYDRVLSDSKYSSATQEYNTDGGQTVSNAVTFDEGPVEYVTFDRPRTEGYHETRIVASESSLVGPQDSWNYQLGWVQQLPWGLALDLGLGLLRRDTYYINNYGARFADKARYGSYGRPWTASLDVNFSAPLPWTRNSGAYARSDSDANSAREAVQQARAEVDAIINDTLLTVDAAFWNLVQQARNVEVAQMHLDNLSQVVRRTERLFELNQITAYEKAHVAADQARVQSQLEQTWYEFLNASDQLVVLLDMAAGTVLLPSGYDHALTVDPQLVMTETPAAPEQHPQVLAADRAARIAELDYQFRRRDAAPDLSINAGVTLGQNHNVFGYASASEAVGHISDPDFISQKYSMVYVYPLGNSAAAAARDQARYRHAQALALRKAAANSAIRRSNDAISVLTSARKIVDLQRKNVELTTFIYDKISSGQQARNVREYELVIKGDELLDARQQLIQAEIDLHLARTNYLAAQGRLPGFYAKLVAQQDLDASRVASIQRSGLLRFFKEVE